MSAVGDLTMKREASKPTAWSLEDMLKNLESRDRTRGDGDDSKSADTCDQAYARGQETSDDYANGDCKQPAPFQKTIESDSDCVDAARKACCPLADGTPCNGTIPCKADEASFKISDADYDKHPWRCFIYENKFFFNPQPLKPDPTSAAWKGGTPICIMHEYINGTAGQDECGNDLYEKVMVESECREAATCLSTCSVGQFTVEGESEKLVANAGCGTLGGNREEKDKCVQFMETSATTPKLGQQMETSADGDNETSADGDSKKEGSLIQREVAPEGRPICKLKNPLTVAQQKEALAKKED
jgi:hypothetical protein